MGLPAPTFVTSFLAALLLFVFGRASAQATAVVQGPSSTSSSTTSTSASLPVSPIPTSSLVFGGHRFGNCSARCGFAYPSLFEWTWSHVTYEHSTTVNVTRATLLILVDTARHLTITKTKTVTYPIVEGYGYPTTKTQEVPLFRNGMFTTSTVTYPTPLLDYYPQYTIKYGTLATKRKCVSYSNSYITPPTHAPLPTSFSVEQIEPSFFSNNDPLGEFYTLVRNEDFIDQEPDSLQSDFQSFYKAQYTTEAGVQSCNRFGTDTIPNMTTPPGGAASSASRTSSQFQTQTHSIGTGGEATEEPSSRPTIIYGTGSPPKATLTTTQQEPLTHTSVQFLTVRETLHTHIPIGGDGLGASGGEHEGAQGGGNTHGGNDHEGGSGGGHKSDDGHHEGGTSGSHEGGGGHHQSSGGSEGNTGEHAGGEHSGNSGSSGDDGNDGNDGDQGGQNSSGNSSGNSSNGGSGSGHHQGGSSSTSGSGPGSTSDHGSSSSSGSASGADGAHHAVIDVGHTSLPVTTTWIRTTKDGHATKAPAVIVGGHTIAMSKTDDISGTPVALVVTTTKHGHTITAAIVGSTGSTSGHTRRTTVPVSFSSPSNAVGDYIASGLQGGHGHTQSSSHSAGSVSTTLSVGAADSPRQADTNLIALLAAGFVGVLI